jgi:CRISPR/Cas system type I-B associated protein Csh2 (Cas7 group RAMP superfamily)
VAGVGTPGIQHYTVSVRATDYKSVRSEGDAETRGSDTYGHETRIDSGYIRFSRFIPQLAQKTGFSEETRLL